MNKTRRIVLTLSRTTVRSLEGDESAMQQARGGAPPVFGGGGVTGIGCPHSNVFGPCQTGGGSACIGIGCGSGPITPQLSIMGCQVFLP